MRFTLLIGYRIAVGSRPIQRFCRVDRTSVWLAHVAFTRKPRRRASSLAEAATKPKTGLNSVKSSQVNTLPKAKSKTRTKQNKDMRKCSSVYSEPTPTQKCPKAISDATGDFFFLGTSLPQNKGGGVGWRRPAAAAAKICSYRSSSSSARQGKRDKYSHEIK